MTGGTPVDLGGTQPAGRSGRRAGDLVTFVVAALGLAWLVALPLWFDGGLASPLFTPIAAAVMVTPTLAVLLVWVLHHRDVGAREWARRTGLPLGPRPGRTVRIALATWGATVLLVLAAAAASVGVGVLRLDLTGFGLFREQAERAGVEMSASQAGTAVAAQVVLAVVLAPLLNILPVLGEEWGWRGWLLPRLLHRGLWPALLWSGLIWGVWHAPLTLLGYNYPELGPGAAALFTGTCILLGVLMGWLRLYSGSVWPPVLAHATLNATAGLVILLGDAAAPPHLAVAGITGLVGWVVLAAVGLVLLRVRPVGTAGGPADATHPGHQGVSTGSTPGRWRDRTSRRADGSPT
ncbi:CPBP family intramembrane glutamic endopeptidase [Pseudonocardia endophytica]|uniref:Membrane protease YdiL (CAAX protease family) n=1 Tax=Pseudonocardia endophytica TaxID=401976 RepID=A0A4R1I0Q4_PSEEN|nr:CPBP family intramembrane glutamic endopeptidase [Pseudonocardia endophytica]TCK26009.1 membrane protease YdiL (CAAX protease family) [Pseudonocardia endophytica]